jgi:hypothetical protein
VTGAWVALQLRRVAPAGMPQPGVAQPIYEGPAPFAFFAPAAALAFVALLIATRRGRKLAFAAGLSAMLGAAVVAVWARSRHSTDLFQDKTFELRADRALVSERGFQSAAGGFQLRFVRDERSLDMGMMEARSQPVGWYRWSGPIYPSAGPIEPSYQSGAIHSWRGFEAQARTMSYGWTQATSRTWSVTFPAWSLVAALAVLPAAWLARPGLRWLRRRRGAKRGLCPACGYDLRASPGQCPECGAMGATLRKSATVASSQT